MSHEITSFDKKSTDRDESSIETSEQTIERLISERAIKAEEFIVTRDREMPNRFTSGKEEYSKADQALRGIAQEIRDMLGPNDRDKRLDRIMESLAYPSKQAGSTEVDFSKPEEHKPGQIAEEVAKRKAEDARRIGEIKKEIAESGQGE